MEKDILITGRVGTVKTENKKKTVKKILSKNVIFPSRISVFLSSSAFLPFSLHRLLLKNVCDFNVLHLVSAVVFCMIVLVCLMYMTISLFR